MVDEVEVSENKEALIVLAGTVAGAATTFVASLPIPLEIKAPSTALATTVTGAILLYWKNKVDKQKTFLIWENLAFLVHNLFLLRKQCKEILYQAEFKENILIINMRDEFKVIS